MNLKTTLSLLMSLVLKTSLTAQSADNGTNLPAGKKYLLIETFSTEYCPNCPSGHKLLHKQVEGRNDVIFVTHHAAFYTDPYSIEQSNELTGFFFNQDYTFAPSIMVNRKDFGYQDTQGPVSNIQKCVNMIRKADQDTMFVTVNMEKEYDKDTRLLKLRIFGQCTKEIENPVINVYITEDSIKSDRQSGYNGTYVHNSTLRAIITPTYGEPIQIENGSYSWKTEYTVPGTITSIEDYGTGECFETELVDENTNIVAFVSNYNPQDPNDCEVYNSFSAGLTKEVVSVENTAADMHENTAYHIGGNLIVDGDFEYAEIYSVCGGMIMRTYDKITDISNLEKGIYIVKITKTGGKENTAKIAVR